MRLREVPPAASAIVEKREMESLNEKRARLTRERAIREALDQIHEMGRYWNTDKKYEEHRAKAVELLVKAMR
jgi:hypothetical protein